jgi:hypothetical protein
MLHHKNELNVNKTKQRAIKTKQTNFLHVFSCFVFSTGETAALVVLVGE